MRGAAGVYRVLLRAYPAQFRARYGREMLLVFMDERRAAGSAGPVFWMGMLWDVARSAPALHIEALLQRRHADLQPQGGTMKTMAILAMLVGLLEVVNTGIEAWAGGVGADPLRAVNLLLAAAVGALLAAAGTAMLRGRRGAAGLGQGAALACLVVFALIRVVQPWMSGASMLLGFGFPIALLLFLRIGRPRGIPTAA